MHRNQLMMMARKFRSPAGDEGGDGGGGGDEGGDHGEGGSSKRTPPSWEYVKDLRRESQTYREKAKANEAAITAAEARAAAAEKDRDEKLTAAQQASDARYITSEVRRAAQKAGMVDLDGIKLLDTSKLKLDEAGEVVGLDDLLAATVKAKPWLFGDTSTSNTGTKVPKGGKQEAKSALDMTPEELKAAKAKAISGR